MHQRRLPCRRPRERELGFDRCLGAGAIPSFSATSGAGAGGPASGSGDGGMPPWSLGAGSGALGAGSGALGGGSGAAGAAFGAVLAGVGDAGGGVVLGVPLFDPREAPSAPSVLVRRPALAGASGSVWASRLVSV